MSLMIGQVPRNEVGPVTGQGEQRSTQFGNWWMQWFNQSYTLLFAMQQSGTTGQRPTTNLYIGRRFWDSTLQKPVYLASVNPPVWKDASGSVV